MSLRPVRIPDGSKISDPSRFTEKSGEKKMKKEETEDVAWRMEGAAHRLQFQIEAADQGETVWNYLTRKKGFTKMQVKRMKFQQGGICINQKQVRVTHVLAAGERLEVSLVAPKQKKSKLQAESEMNSGMMPDILYEDRDVLAVWKPHGMILHPSHGHHGDTLMDRSDAGETCTAGWSGGGGCSPV